MKQIREKCREIYVEKNKEHTKQKWSTFPLFVTIIATCFLAGCSTTPPSSKKAICSGTARPYQINGKWYYPQDHHEYDEEGIASWYGPGFHKRSTSCGHTYDMHGLSAAHKTLPIPSVVKVTNTKTGKSLNLVVNDRGPFVDDRIIDLSKGAAQALGVHQKGLEYVRVETLPEESKALETHLSRYGRYGKHPQGKSWDAIYRTEIAGRAHEHSRHETSSYEVVEDQPKQKKSRSTVRSAAFPVATPAFKSIATQSPSPTHYVEIGATRQKPKAQTIMSRLRHIGPARIQEHRHAQGHTLYVIHLGPYSTQSKAKNALKSVSQLGYRQAKIIEQ